MSSFNPRAHEGATTADMADALERQFQSTRP